MKINEIQLERLMYCWLQHQEHAEYFRLKRKDAKTPNHGKCCVCQKCGWIYRMCVQV